MCPTAEVCSSLSRLWVLLIPLYLAFIPRFGKLLIELPDQVVHACSAQQAILHQLLQPGFLDVNQVLAKSQKLIMLERAAGNMKPGQLLA
jgi:hypothetical protein